MRLTELGPEWYEKGDRGVVGVTFACPRCKRERLRVYFREPADGKGPAISGPMARTWDHMGKTFDTLSLSPSLDFSPFHAHFNVTNGEVSVEASTLACR